MGSSFANLKWRLLLAVAVAASVSPANAQRRGGQPILMSAPEGDTVLTNAPSLAPKAPDLPDFSDTIHASGFDFNAPNDAGSLPAPAAPAMSAVEAARLQALRDKNRNWTTMTPEEIMGVPTPEKIFSVPGSDDATGTAQKKTQAARLLDRQQRLQNARTNTVPADGFPDQDFSGNRTVQWNPNFLTSPNDNLENPAAMNSFVGSEAKNAMPDQNPSAGWLKSPAPPMSVRTPEQQADLDQFRQLLEPRSPPPSAVSAARSGGIISAPRTTPDSLFENSSANLIGMPSSPATTGIGAPAGVAPLPGILGQTNAVSATAPGWKPELPPWMSSTPRLGEIPQRKF